MRISNRILSLPADNRAAWGIYYKAREMAARGERIVELTVGEHDVPTANSVLEVMHRSTLAGKTGYSVVPGVDRLREHVARRVADRTGVRTSRENVLITTGGQAALFIAHAAVLDPGDVGLIVEPFYPTYPGTIRAVGGRVTAIPTSPDRYFEPEPNVIADHLDGALSLLVNSPNNPAAIVYSCQTIEGIAEIARANDLWIISDEVYETQVWKGEHLSIRSLPGMRDRTVTVGSMSKGHAMTGSRIGWIVAPRPIIGPMIELATVLTFGVPIFIQEAADFALGQGRRFEQAIAAPFRRRRDLAMKILGSQDRVRFIPPMGTMYLMLDISPTGLSGEAFAERLLIEERIAVLPGSSFGQCAIDYVVLALKPLRNQFSSTLSAWVLRGIRNIGCQIAALEVDFKLNFGPETGRSGQISRFGDDSTHLAPGACGQS